MGGHWSSAGPHRTHVERASALTRETTEWRRRTPKCDRERQNVRVLDDKRSDLVMSMKAFLLVALFGAISWAETAMEVAGIGEGQDESPTTAR